MCIKELKVIHSKSGVLYQGAEFPTISAEEFSEIAAASDNYETQRLLCDTLMMKKQNNIESDYIKMIKEMPILDLLNGLEYDKDGKCVFSSTHHYKSDFLHISITGQVLSSRTKEINTTTYFRIKEDKDPGWYNFTRIYTIYQPREKLRNIKRGERFEFNKMNFNIDNESVQPLLFLGLMLLAAMCIIVGVNIA